MAEHNNLRRQRNFRTESPATNSYKHRENPQFFPAVKSFLNEHSVILLAAVNAARLAPAQAD